MSCGFHRPHKSFFLRKIQPIFIGRRNFTQAPRYFTQAARLAAPMSILPYFAISSQICYQILEDCCPRHENCYILAGRQQEKTSFNLAFILHIFLHLFYLLQVIQGDWSEGLKVSRANKVKTKGSKQGEGCILFSFLFFSVFIMFTLVFLLDVSAPMRG